MKEKPIWIKLFQLGDGLGEITNGHNHGIGFDTYNDAMCFIEMMSGELPMRLVEGQHRLQDRYIVKPDWDKIEGSH